MHDLSARAPSDAAPRSVLILEDEPFIALDVEDTVMQAGFDVGAVCSSSRAAEEWLAGNTVDIAIIDVELADGSCVEFAKKLRFRGIPFLVHSGSDALSPYRDPIFRGARWVNKPCSPSDLVTAIHAVMADEPSSATGVRR